MLGAVVGSVTLTPGSVAYATKAFDVQPTEAHIKPMTIDQATIDRGVREANAYTDNKVLGLGGRLDVVDVRLKGIDAKLADWTSVPTDLAALKERVNHLPTKDELGTKLRNYLTAAGAVFAMVGTVIGLVFKFVGH